MVDQQFAQTYHAPPHGVKLYDAIALGLAASTKYVILLGISSHKPRTRNKSRGGAIWKLAGLNLEKALFMSTKLKGDIAEQATILRLLELGWGVAKPLGDRLSYDLIADINGKLVKLQVKSAWFNAFDQNYCIDVRRTKTNRRKMIRSLYSNQDFDFALIYLPEKRVFYVFPVNVFIGFGSTLSLVETDKRQRKPRSANYREAFKLISQWAASKVTLM